MFCLIACVSTMYMPGSLRGQKRLSDLLKLKFRLAMYHTIWVLGISGNWELNTVLLQEQQLFLTGERSSQSHHPGDF